MATSKIKSNTKGDAFVTGYTSKDYGSQLINDSLQYINGNVEMLCPPTAGYYDMIVLPHKPKVANTRGSAFIGRGADNPMYAPVELRDDSHGYIYFSPECIAKYNGLTVGIRMDFSYTIE